MLFCIFLHQKKFYYFFLFIKNFSVHIGNLFKQSGKKWRIGKSERKNIKYQGFSDWENSKTKVHWFSSSLEKRRAFVSIDWAHINFHSFIFSLFLTGLLNNIFRVSTGNALIGKPVHDWFLNILDGIIMRIISIWIRSFHWWFVKNRMSKLDGWVLIDRRMVFIIIKVPCDTELVK